MHRIWLQLYSFLQLLMQHLSIRWRIALVSLGLLTLLLVALGILILFATERTLMTNQATALRNEARLAVGGIRNHPASADRSTHPVLRTALLIDRTIRSMAHHARCPRQ